MSLHDPNLTILDFDGTYEEQTELCARFPHRDVDFRTLRGTSLYCSQQAFSSIRNLLPRSREPAVTLIGSGNYHFVALALLSQIEKPFSLVLIDHHTDSAEGEIPNLISCGNWIRHAFRQVPQLRRVLMIGQTPAAVTQLSPNIREKTRYLTPAQLSDVTELLADIPTEDLYLSFDKDALDPTQAVTNWDQGELQLPALLPELKVLTREKHLCGADICGEFPASPLDLFKPDVREAIRKNECANERLLDVLLGAA